VRPAWALLGLALAAAAVPSSWPAPSPAPRRARELHRPSLKRPAVHAPPRLAGPR